MAQDAPIKILTKTDMKINITLSKGRYRIYVLLQHLFEAQMLESRHERMEERRAATKQDRNETRCVQMYSERGE